MDTVPTAENLARLWYGELQNSIASFFEFELQDPPKLVEVKVWETPNCSAVYPW